MSTGSDSGNSLVLQPDGKILLGGTCDNKFCVARFNSDGSLDTTFGTGGYFILDIPGSNPDNARSLLLQPDGKILLGGFCLTGGIQKFCIARIR
ncbi:MAG: delta-60 repeat domain-containing protein [Leptonema sp. (in: bacteria)]